jgi:hypothetical protein
MSWDGGWEDVISDCRYEEERCAAEMLVDDEVVRLGLSLSVDEREEAIEVLLESGVMVRFEESRGGDSYTPVVEPNLDPRQAIASVRTRWSPRSVRVVRRAPVRRAGRRSVRKQRRLVRRPARAPGRLDDPDEQPLAGGRCRRIRARVGCS